MRCCPALSAEVDEQRCKAVLQQLQQDDVMTRRLDQVRPGWCCLFGPHTAAGRLKPLNATGWPGGAGAVHTPHCTQCAGSSVLHARPASRPLTPTPPRCRCFASTAFTQAILEAWDADLHSQEQQEAELAEHRRVAEAYKHDAQELLFRVAQLARDQQKPPAATGTAAAADAAGPGPEQTKRVRWDD